MAKSSYTQNLERRANDLLRVYNPLDEDMVTEWDRKNGTKLFRVPAKQEEVLPRYIAEKYIREMYLKIMTDKVNKRVVRENEERIKKGMQAMTRWDEQLRFEVETKTSHESNANKIVATLYVGLEREYGIDTVKQEVAEKDEKPAFEKALSQVQQEKDSGVAPPTPEKTELGVLQCDYPGCDFAAKSRAGLMSHKRSHRAETSEIINKKEEAVASVSQ